MAGRLRTVVVTGANSGLGFLAARRFALTGRWRVLLCCRSGKKAQDAVDIILGDASLPSQVKRRNQGLGSSAPEIVAVDAPLPMHDLAGVQKFAETLLDEYLPDGVDVLVNNAGMMWPQKDDEPSPFNKDDPVPKVTQTATVNAIAPTLLTTLLQPDMRTVSVIPDPTELSFLSYPLPLDLVCEISFARAPLDKLNNVPPLKRTNTLVRLHGKRRWIKLDVSVLV